MPLDIDALQSRYQASKWTNFQEWQTQRRVTQQAALEPKIEPAAETVELDDEERVETLTWLDVPYREKDNAKMAGAWWDSGKKMWYAPAHTNLGPLKRWRKECRVYLQCNDTSTATIKDVGGRWDHTECKWYVTTDMDTRPFREWLPE